LNSRNLIVAAMYLRRVRVAGRKFSAAPTHGLTVVTPLALAAQISGVGNRWPCRGRRLAGEEQLGRCAAQQRKYNRPFVQRKGSPRGYVPSASSSSLAVFSRRL
jgi:hypothetical protein